MFRKPRTTAERKANQDGWERRKRNYKVLPNTYDDVYAHREKCWKRYRRNQYRTINNTGM